MKSVTDKSVRDELIARISLLSENTPSAWGKMNVLQMIKHCVLWEEMALGKTKYKRVFIGRIFGKMALKTVLKDDSPLRRNTPTLPAFIITVTSGNIAVERDKWVAIINQYEYLTNDNFIPPFFGKMTSEQTGYMAYKHTDHHLRQFGA